MTVVSVLNENAKKFAKDLVLFAEVNTRVPVLNNIYVQSVGSQLFGVSTNLSWFTQIVIGAKVDRSGEFTVNAVKFEKHVSNMSKDRLDITCDDPEKSVRLKCGTSKATLRTLSADEFPVANANFEVPSKAVTIKLDDEQLLGLQSIVNSAAKEDNRPILTAVHIRRIGKWVTFAAADGYHLATIEYQDVAGEDFEANVPAKVFVNMFKMSFFKDENRGEVSLSFYNETYWIQFMNVVIKGDQLYGRYPDFAAIIPKSHLYKATVIADDLLRKTKLALVLSTDNACSTLYKFESFEQSTVTVLGISAEYGDSDSVVDFYSEQHSWSCSIALNAWFMIEYLTAAATLGHERAVLYLSGPENPLKIMFEGDDKCTFTGIIMPMSSK